LGHRNKVEVVVVGLKPLLPHDVVEEEEEVVVVVAAEMLQQQE
jgi:hypothetical protein